MHSGVVAVMIGRPQKFTGYTATHHADKLSAGSIALDLLNIKEIIEVTIQQMILYFFLGECRHTTNLALIERGWFFFLLS